MVDTVLEQVVEAIAEAEGTAPEDLDMSLHHYVSTDAIQSLVAHESNAWRLQFETSRHVVELTGDDTIRVDGERYRTVA